jgi:hypothetical protein
MHNNGLIWINYIKKWKWLLTWRISKAWWVIFSLIIHHPRLCTRAYTLCFYVFNSFLTMDNVLFWRLCNELLIIFDFHCAFIIFFLLMTKWARDMKCCMWAFHCKKQRYVLQNICLYLGENLDAYVITLLRLCKIVKDSYILNCKR